MCMRNSLLTLLVLLLIGCTNKFENEYTSSSSEKDTSDAWIFEAADNAFREFYPAKSRSHSLSERKIAVITNGISRSGSSDTILSIVNYSDNEGFVIIDNKHKEILAVSDNGEIDPKDIENLGVRIFLNKAIDYSLNNREDTIIEIVDSGMIEFTDFVEPRCPYPWGQEYPAGELCPNKVAGCSPLALAIALSYFEKPQVLVLKHDDNSRRRISWRNMKDNVVSYRYSEVGANLYDNYPVESNFDKTIKDSNCGFGSGLLM